MVRRRWPAFGSAIQAAALRMLSGGKPVMRAASSTVVRFASTAASKPVVEASMKARSTQPRSAISVSSALNSTMSVPDSICRCSTFPAPASASAASTFALMRATIRPSAVDWDDR